MPRLFFSNQFTEMDWDFKTESGTACNMFTTECRCPRGKMLGGSHGINGMFYIRGNDRDLNRWAKLGNPTWNYENVLQYFKKSEANKSPALSRDERHHNTPGELPVSDYINDDDQDPDANMFIDAWKELGIERLSDFNADKWIGTAFAQGNVCKGRRRTTANNFLVSPSKRQNLHN